MIRTCSLRASLLTALLLGNGSLFAQYAPGPAASTVHLDTAPPAVPAGASKTCPDCAARRRDFDGLPTQTFYLKYATSANEMNEIAAALRQLLSSDDRTFVIPSQDAIMVRAIPEDIALAQKVLDNLDRPKKAFRLTYTVTEMDGANRVGAQHYTMDLVDGQQTTLQQSSRVPFAMGATSTNYTYQDIGTTFNATLSLQGNGARLSTSIDQNSAADQSGAAAETYHPIVTRTASLKGSYLLTPNKPLVLGAMDIPGSSRHLEIEVLMEPLP